ncbi:MAG TPA: MFS transporter [Stellaceae bacterium]
MRLNQLFFAAFGAARGATGAEASLSVAERPRRSRWGVLELPDFRRLWMVGLVAFGVRWLEILVVGVFVYQHTGSAFAVALMTMLRSLPMALFGALIGALADRVERKKALIGVVLLMLCTSLCLAVLAYIGRLEVWHLAVASFCNGIAWAADNPVRRVMIGDVVGSERMGAAMSVDVGANNASRMLGPTIGGLLLVGVGISGAFTVSVLCYLISLIAVLRLRRGDAQTPPSRGGVIEQIIEGLMLVRGDPRLIATLVITVIYNAFGWPFTSMIPVIGQDNLHLGAGGIGVLASMDGVGAFCGAVLLGIYARPAHYARIYVGSVACYLVLLILFALVPNVEFAGTALLLTGLFNAGFSVMQATLIYLAAPPEMRSRMYGVLSVCIGVSPLGFLWIGLLADAIGAPAATAITGLMGLAALFLTRHWWRRSGAS